MAVSARVLRSGSRPGIRQVPPLIRHPSLRCSISWDSFPWRAPARKTSLQITGTDGTFHRPTAIQAIRAGDDGLDALLGISLGSQTERRDLAFMGSTLSLLGCLACVATRLLCGAYPRRFGSARLLSLRRYESPCPIALL